MVLHLMLAHLKMTDFVCLFVWVLTYMVDQHREMLPSLPTLFDPLTHTYKIITCEKLLHNSNIQETAAENPWKFKADVSERM